MTHDLAESIEEIRKEAKSAPRLVREAVEEAAEYVSEGRVIPDYLREILSRWRGRMAGQDKYGKALA